MTLIDRLSKLDGADREVDREIHAYFGLPFSEVLCDKPFLYNAYTASIDAAIALAERVLPNERVQLNRIAFDGKCQWRASLTGNHTSWSPVPAIALCIALLRAKEASDDQAI